MAGAHSDGGTMDITEHRKTWGLFIKLIEWSIGGIFLLMLFLMMFRTHD